MGNYITIVHLFNNISIINVCIKKCLHCAYFFFLSSIFIPCREITFVGLFGYCWFFGLQLILNIVFTSSSKTNIMKQSVMLVLFGTKLSFKDRSHRHCVCDCIVSSLILSIIIVRTDNSVNHESRPSSLNHYIYESTIVFRIRIYNAFSLEQYFI